MFTKALRFTLIELLVSKTCQTGVLLLHSFSKFYKKMPYNACKASASCTAHNAVFAPAKTLPSF